MKTQFEFHIKYAGVHVEDSSLRFSLQFTSPPCGLEDTLL